MTIKQLFDKSTLANSKHIAETPEYHKYLHSEWFMCHGDIWYLSNSFGNYTLSVEVDIVDSLMYSDEKGNHSIPLEYVIKIEITPLWTSRAIFSTSKVFEKGSIVDNIKYLLEKVLSDDY